MAYQNLIFEKKEHIGTLTFNRPKVLNALNRQTMDELGAALTEAGSDKDLRVLAASRSFYLTFKVARTDTQGRPLYALGDGQWDIPRLRLLLENIVPEHGVMDDYEVEHHFPDIGRRTMLLNARKVF